MAPHQGGVERLQKTCTLPIWKIYAPGSSRVVVSAEEDDEVLKCRRKKIFKTIVIY